MHATPDSGTNPNLAKHQHFAHRVLQPKVVQGSIPPAILASKKVDDLARHESDHAIKHDPKHDADHDSKHDSKQKPEDGTQHGNAGKPWGKQGSNQVKK